MNLVHTITANFLVTVVTMLSLGGMYATISVWWMAYRSRQWPTAPGTVIVSDEIVDAKGIPYHFQYSFAVDGKEYISNCIKAYSTENDERSYLREHPVGANLLVYYRPDFPNTSVVIPGASARLGVFTIAVVLLCAGLTALVSWA